MYESFLPKIIEHLNTSSTPGVKNFWTSFQKLLIQHIENNTTEETLEKFSDEVNQKYLMYVLRRITETLIHYEI